MATQYQVNTTLSNGTTINSGTIVIPDATIPIANSTTIGGVMPVAKTDAMTQEVGVDSEGRLYTTPGGGGGGGGDVTVVQDLGTSTTAVISQNGINNLLRGNNALLGDINLVSTATVNTVLIGTNAHDYTSGSTNCIAIGTNTEAGAVGGVAIGANTHIYSTAYNCTAIGPNVTIEDGVMNTIAFGHDFSVTQIQSNSLIVQGYNLVDFTTGKINSERLPDIPTFTDNGDGTMTITTNDSTYKVAIITS